MVRTFNSSQDKAQYYIDHFATIIYNGARKDINKVAIATGNREPSESLKLSAQAALWITVCENPEKPLKETLKLAKDLFSSWIKNEYNDEILRGRNRKNSPESYSRTPWGTSIQNHGILGLVSLGESPDKLAERQSEMKRLTKAIDKLILEWGPHSAVWAIANFRSDKGVIDTARKLGFTEEQLGDKKLINKLRKVYRVLNNIRLEMEQIE